MARGREDHQAYLNQLSLLGKDLARRAKSRCELSQERGTLEVVDLFEEQKDPTLEGTVMISPQVRAHLEGRDLGQENQLRYLEDVVWSVEPAVREAARRILVQLDFAWARDALDNLETMEGAVTQE